MEMTEASYRIIADLLEARTGQRLSDGRRWRMGTALAGTLRKHGLANADQLVALLVKRDTATLADAVVDALLNNETYFFRDQSMFDLLQSEVLPELAERRASVKRLSIWSAGCSSGQEALSLAMMLRENAASWAGWTIEIVGTDVSQAVIAKAQNARYSQFEIQRGLGVNRMLEHFTEDAGHWRPVPELRRMVRFCTDNLLDMSARTQPFDLILCRNVLLYFDTQRRNTAFRRMSRTMRCDGYLMLGSGEDILGGSDLLEPAAQDARLFTHRRLHTPYTQNDRRYA
ncbi:MAG: protein-glutamate O-methyltransferase CheR [Pontixanthobacter sp.]